MKIWVDLRFLKRDNLYSLFAFEIVKELSKNTNYKIVVFLNDSWDVALFNSLIKTEVVKEKSWSLIENISLKTQFKKQNFDLMVFFNEFKPITYKWKYIIVIPSLHNVLFWRFKSSLSKYFYLSLLWANLKYAAKIICFDKQTLNHLNERFNIKEEKINIIKGFFPIRSITCSVKLNLDIKTKHSLTNNYIIYDSNEASVKNLERVFYAIKKMKNEWIKLSLFVIWNDNCKNLEFRKAVIDNNINELVYFIWELNQNEKEAYYRQSSWIIFSNLYDTFPFDLNFALVYKKPILASNLESIRELFWDKISYFNILSNNNTYESVLKFSKSEKEDINYDDVINSNNPQNYSKDLMKVIEEVTINSK